MILSAKIESAHKKKKTKQLHSTQLSPEVENNFLLPDNKYFLLNFFTESN